MDASSPTLPAPAVLVWRNTLLPGSETFIRNQVDSTLRWRPTLAGAGRVSSVLTRETDSVLFGEGRIEWVKMKAFRLLRWSPRLNRLIRESQAELIHAHFGPDAVTIAPTARRFRLPLVVTVHGHDVTSHSLLEGRRGRRYRRRALRSLNYATTIVAVSEFIRDQVIANLGADPSKVVVHHIGIPVPVERTTEPQSGRWDIVFVGRLVDKKGVPDLLAAIAELPEDLRSVRLAIVGDGALREVLENRVGELGLDATFLGAQSPDQVRSILSRSRIFAGPSRTAASGDSEGFGMVFLEAAAAGLPVVSYRHGGVPEAVEDGVTGLLAPEGDVSSLTQCLAALLEDSSESERMGMRGRERVTRSFDVVAQTRLLESIYDDAVSAR